MHKYFKENIIKILYTTAKIEKRIKVLAAQITNDYANKDLIVVSVLRGSIMFVSELIKNIDLPLELDFIWVKSYAQTESTGKVKLLKKPDSKLAGRDVLLVDDILDTGYTFSRTIEILKEYSPRSIRTAALLNKPARRKLNIKLDYCGFEIGNEFVVGYGMDFQQKYRNLPFLGVMKI